jgi:hypothetical protein
MRRQSQQAAQRLNASPSSRSHGRLMRRWAPLNERHLDVLPRVSDGTVSSRDWELARTVYALRDRKLVETTKGSHR